MYAIRSYYGPEDGRLRLLMRVQLEAMRDINFPLVGPGYLDIARADQALLDAANIWIVNDLVLYENDEAIRLYLNLTNEMD